MTITRIVKKTERQILAWVPEHIPSDIATAHNMTEDADATIRLIGDLWYLLSEADRIRAWHTCDAMDHHEVVSSLQCKIDTLARERDALRVTIKEVTEEALSLRTKMKNIKEWAEK